MNWYENLYVGKTAKKKKDRLIRRLESGRTAKDAWLITLPQGPANQLEILSALNLRFWYKNRECPMIIGIAGSKEEAIELLLEITEDVLRRTQNAGLRDFFTQSTVHQ